MTYRSPTAGLRGNTMAAMVGASGFDVTTGSGHVGGAGGGVVLGMARSGTSAVTRMLVTSGFYAGADSELMEANPANPAGFWENLAVFRVNEEILERVGGTWFMPPTSEAQLAARLWAVPKLRNVVSRLLAEAGGAPLAIKDPRIGVLLKLWGPVIDGILHPVLVVRNPVEIALSLAKRDGTPTAFALASWELHMARLLEYLHGRAVTVAPYAQLGRSPETVRMVVGAVAARITEECVAHVDPGAAAKAIEPGLHRQRAAFTDLPEHLTGRQADLWRFLEGLSPGNQILNAPVELTRPSHAAAPLTRCENNRVRESRSAEELRAQTATLESALAEQRQRGEAAEHAHAQAQHWLEVIQSSASWRLTAPLRAIMRALRRARATLLRSARAPASSIASPTLAGRGAEAVYGLTKRDYRPSRDPRAARTPTRGAPRARVRPGGRRLLPVMALRPRGRTFPSRRG